MKTKTEYRLWRVEVEDDNFEYYYAKSELDAITQAEADGHAPLWAEVDDD